ncbi:MAG: RidA family protein [Clostridia bacterium]
MKKIIATEQAPQAIGPYSQACEAGGVIYISGQIPINPINGELPQGIAEQTRQAFENVIAILAAERCAVENIVKVTVYLKDMADFAEMNRVYAGVFTGDFPARAAVEVSALPRNALIELDVIAHHE